MRSTIINKKKNLKCGCYDFAFSKGRCKTHALLEDGKPIKRVSDKRWENEFSNESLSNLDADLVYIFSLYIRLKYADKNGMVKCFTCPKVLHYTKIHNSHYIHRTDQATRHLEANCKPMCPSCNNLHNEDNEPYKAALELESSGITDWLLEQSRMVYKPTISEFKEMIIDYRYKVEILKSKLTPH